MSIKFGVVMDPIAKIQPKKDTTLALLLEAQQRGWQNYYIRPQDISFQQGQTWARMHPVKVQDKAEGWHDLSEAIFQPLNNLDVVFVREDPPVDAAYLYVTHLLEHAEHKGLLVVNKPAALRDMNEKFYTNWFSCCPETLVTCDLVLLHEFIGQHGKVVVKPLDAMGGHSIFCVDAQDVNKNVILEVMTQMGEQIIVAQPFLPAISQGDKRVIMLAGEAVPYALQRLPAAGDFRGNLRAGGHAQGVTLTSRDQEICAEVGPILKEKGVLLAGLDIIGDYLTEINITSPTCIREIEALFGINICHQLLDQVQQQLVER